MIVEKPMRGTLPPFADGNPAGLFLFSRPWRDPSPDGRAVG